MDLRDLHSPDDFRPTPSVRYRVLTVTPNVDMWAVHVRDITWDEDGNSLDAPQQQTLTHDQLRLLKQIWQAQRFDPVARYQSGQAETIYYENRDDRDRLEAQTSPAIPAAIEVWISATNGLAFHCQVPRSIAFSAYSPEELAAKGVAITEVPVVERRGTLTARVVWMNGQPSAEAKARWQPVIERKVRGYLQSKLSQSSKTFVKGIIADSLRLGDDYRDLMLAGVNMAERLVRLQALDYAPMAD